MRRHSKGMVCGGADNGHVRRHGSVGTLPTSGRGAELLANPMICYVQRPGSVQQVAHPCGGDACTVIQPSVAALGELADATHRLRDHVVIRAGLDLLADPFRGVAI